MQIELLDQPILIVGSASPKGAIAESPQEALLQIESLLEEEIVEIRNKLHSDDKNLFSDYLSEFNLHLQTEDEVISVVLESEWQDQMGEGFLPTDGLNDAEDIMDLRVSELMRTIRITYSGDDFEERKKLYQWLSSQTSNIPIVSGLCSFDYLFVSAKDIISSMSSLREVFEIA